MRMKIALIAALVAIGLPALASLTFGGGVWTLSWTLTPAEKTRLIDAFDDGYPSTLLCVAGKTSLTACEVRSTIGVADLPSDACTAGQIGNQVANPFSVEQYVSNRVRCIWVQALTERELETSIKTVVTGGPPPIGPGDP